MPRIFWFLLAGMMAVWLAMNLWTVPTIEEISGGLRIFDMRFTGYSFDEAQAFLAALGEEGAATYLGLQLWLDWIFPVLLGAVLFLGYRWLYPGWPGVVIGAVSLFYVATDIYENIAVAAMLRAGAEGLTPEMVVTANRWTTLKWGMAVVGLVMLIVGIVMRLRARRAAAAP
ncbi:hypothetical protein [Marimonas arenosa]|uniref:Uncharacterized protein n=1 Tax=Marimonas arenosa TaxID=1795305 RepID=A0AAE4B3I6_9RHOB|nr:hypothetical protein [Marimonas arenosa]MDQ2089287.1 hypothetical protein [Marimonas arenosa]